MLFHCSFTMICDLLCSFIDQAENSLQIKYILVILIYIKINPNNNVLLNPERPCYCKQCRSRSVGFWRSQLIWTCTVCHSVYELMSTIWIKIPDWLKIRIGCGILIYSAWHGLRVRFRLNKTRFSILVVFANHSKAFHSSVAGLLCLFFFYCVGV